MLAIIQASLILGNVILVHAKPSLPSVKLADGFIHHAFVVTQNCNPYISIHVSNQSNISAYADFSGLYTGVLCVKYDVGVEPMDPTT